MSKTPTRKSIIANFGALTADIISDDPKLENNTEPLSTTSSGSAPRVGAGVIGATQRAISDIRDERDRLKALLDSGGSGFQELDPLLIDPSPYPDRLPEHDDREFAAFKALFAAEGQKVPIQVRPNPRQPGRYEVVYGHRRLRAAKELGLLVKALVIDMSDHDLVVSQGIENSSRQDLTWIERAVFAKRMEAADIKPKVIKAALVIDDAELAKMRSVTRSITLSLIELVGRAPKVGRPRWQQLAQLMIDDGSALERALKTLSSDKVSSLSSDQRFHSVLTELAPRLNISEPNSNILRDKAGHVVAKMSMSKRDFHLTLVKGVGSGFGAFLAAELPALFERFRDANTQTNPVKPLSDDKV